MDLSETRLPGRLVPTGGGHVPVRVHGFLGSAAPSRARRSERGFAVELARTSHGVVKVMDGETVLGYLTPAWSRAVDFELWACEQAGTAAVARAMLEGVADDRDLFVMLAWRRRG